MCEEEPDKPNDDGMDDMDEEERKTMETYRAQLEWQLEKLNERLQQAVKKRRVKHEAGVMALPVEPVPEPPAATTPKPKPPCSVPASRPKPSSKRQASPAPSVASIASTAKPANPGILPSSKPRPVAAPLRSTQPVPKDLRPLLSEAGDTEAEDDEASIDSGAGQRTPMAPVASLGT